ncbi:uncharacterized protein BX663DRAFT_554491 [Cokeromyces recurvatus]|uniref:uncharacterized protein n=1 Tax=Cokeromyces recurvatus TaxID=90255 RepID=UPI0022203EE5|nr:uncharacterized protein BX663DRAFT_554491 [Cokeromyces recurvatus]KAI7900047.1 hypothetical protein BX663DRAFT_554491 [Cokeromyces recurvatus]
MLHTFIILDGHPDAFAPLTRVNDQSIDPTHQIPTYPLWTSMVQSSLDFCRIVWDIQQTKRYIINVLVAGKTPILLNNTSEQDIRILQQKFPHVQPRQSYSHDRIQATIENALQLYQEQSHEYILSRCRIILVIVAKDQSEKQFEFRNNPQDPVRDLQAIVYESLNKVNNANPSKSISHVQVDVLRSLSFSDTPEHLIQDKIISKKVTHQITMSAYNIPNGQDDLKYAMRHLAQLYYNINILHISNIPMKSAAEQIQQQSTRTVTLYYQANGHHLINQQEPLRNSLIHDPAYLKYRELKLIYSKRSKRSLSESEWCSCIHTISPLKLHDGVTQVYLDMIFKGSVSYLVLPELSHTKSWTHTLMVEDGTIFLCCFNNQLQQQFTEAKDDIISLSKVVKIEGFVEHHETKGMIPKTTELVDTIIRPNLFDNMKQLLHETSTNPLCRTVSFNPFLFSHHLPIITHSKLVTSRSIEKATRWRTCFRDCEGTNLFPVTLHHRSIEDLAMDVLNGVPISSGFGIALGLIHDLFEQLQDIFFKDIISSKDVSMTKELINMIVSELKSGMEGAGKKLFVKGLGKEHTKLLSKKLLVALYLIGKRFQKDSDKHKMLCNYIVTTIKEKIDVLSTQITDYTKNTTTEIKAEDVAWNQFHHYENMSLREREDAAQGLLPETKNLKTVQNDNTMFKGQSVPLYQIKNEKGIQQQTSVKYNPNFRSRRGQQTMATTHTTIPATVTAATATATATTTATMTTTTTTSRDIKDQTSPLNQYPNPSAAIPYLTFIAPTIEEKEQEEKEEEASLGKPGNLLWLYWMNDKLKKRGHHEEGDISSDAELVYKDHQWKRVKKEFLGRLAQPGEKGETS